MIEPRLDIERIAQDGQETVRLRLSAAVAPARLFRGKSPAEVLRLVPLVFNLCPAAHRAAASSALGVEPAAGTDLALATEILREHALAMLHDLPRALGMETGGAAIGGLGSLSVAGLAVLEANLFGVSAAEFLRHTEEAAASGDTLPLHLLRLALGWPAEWGAAPLEGDPTFFARCLSDPLIARQVKGGKASLYLRMLARLREAARLIEDIRKGKPTRRYGRLAKGSGWADAARGRLVHQAKLVDGAVADYRISTPTETMIAPDGFLERLLNSALGAPPEERDAVFAIALGCARPCLEVSTSEKAA